MKNFKKIKKRWFLLGLLIISMGLCSIPEVVHENTGVSESTGRAREGKLNNGWLLPYKGPNFHYFSWMSYYILDNAYVHSTVHKTLLEAYKTCETTCPGQEFVLMECTKKGGGRMLLHWTHQNGTSVDFMTPVRRGDDTDPWPNHTGLFHYLLGFDKNGKFRLGKKTEIDFETMARHLIALDDAAKNNGLQIRKILFHTDLHEELFNTTSGQILAQRNINFIKHLGNLINRVHDDHYHVDFEMVSGE